MWNPDQYLRFKEERTLPSRDLCARIPLEAPGTILDAGCGPGNSTQVLRDRWPGARITGLDSSAEMIAKAREAHPQGDWLVADLAEYRGGPYDLVFSNAVLQWLPGHAQLLPRLMGLLAPGGILAVQVPSQARFPVREAMEAVARLPRFRTVLEGAGGSLTFHDPRFYYEHLSGLAGSLDLWVTTYYHVLPDHQGMIDWMESTGMRPYLERLDPEGQAAYKAQVLECCVAAFPACSDGKVLMPFERLFFLASRR